MQRWWVQQFIKINAIKLSKNKIILCLSLFRFRKRERRRRDRVLFLLCIAALHAKGGLSFEFSVQALFTFNHTPATYLLTYCRLKLYPKIV